nr:hypothetical protein Itr_chr04CG22980 [Ipomoea trifida]
MGESKRKWTVGDEETSVKRRNLGVKKANRRCKNNGQKGGESKNDAREMAADKAGVDEELEEMKKMSIHEAEMAAAKAVAEAEAAVAAAERAVEEANKAERIAEEMGKEFNSKSLHQKQLRWWQKI